jgi:hypothetical protein
MALPLPAKVPEPGFYYHYKHDPEGSVDNYAYEVLAVGFHTEDDHREGEAHFLMYRPLYDTAAVYQYSLRFGIQCVDARPLEMWMEDVEIDDKPVPRFSKVTDESVILNLTEIRERMYPS